jgi:apolipoprotein N-acyltransferase
LIDQLARGRSQSMHFLVLFLLGAILAGVAEFPYGGWIQIPILSFIWYWLLKDNLTSAKHLFASGLTFGLGYFVLGLWWLYIDYTIAGRVLPQTSVKTAYRDSLS